MGRKGMLRFFNLHFRHHHQQQDHSSIEPQSRNCHSFSAKLMEENISTAETIIVKWDTNSTNPNTTNLIQDKEETRRFIQAVTDLQSAMVFFTSSECTEDPTLWTHSLVSAQGLMQTAMRRLEKELHQILSSNRDRLDPEVISSVRSNRASESDLDSEEENQTIRDSISEVERASANAMADLRSIAQAMISAGYGKECIIIYKLMRKSIVDEGLYRLGFEFPTLNQIQKLDWPVLDLKIRTWLKSSRVAVGTLFAGERILCDQIFEGSDMIRDCCFADITRDAAVNLLGFPEMVTKTKRSPEKLYRILDLYNSISDLSMDIESVFSFESTTAVRSQALNSLMKLAEAARLTLSDFESAIQKDESKTSVPGGGIHPMTRYVMDYITSLADYDIALAEIYTGVPIDTPHLPESFPIDMPPSQSSFEASPKSEISVRFAWLILVLHCKVDGKAEKYKEAALSYLFLANNLQYIVNKVKESRLGFLLGDDWIVKNSAKAKYYVASYERLGWSRVAEAIPRPWSEDTATAEEKIRVFNANFEEAVRVQRGWVIADPEMREEVRSSVAKLIVPAYREFYEAYRPLVSGDVANTEMRFAPEDVMGRVKELFRGSAASGSGRESWSGTGFGSIHGSGKSSWWSRSLK